VDSWGEDTSGEGEVEGGGAALWVGDVDVEGCFSVRQGFSGGWGEVYEHFFAFVKLCGCLPFSPFLFFLKGEFFFTLDELVSGLFFFLKGHRSDDDACKEEDNS